MLVSLIFVFACLVRFVLMFRLAEFSENTTGVSNRRCGQYLSNGQGCLRKGPHSNQPISRELTAWQTIVLGGLCLIVGNAIQLSAPPFPVFVMAYIINGFGLALGVCF